MNDKQLIERLRHCAACDDCAVCQDFCKEDCIEDLMSTAADRISDLLTELREENRWIPISERMPDKEWLELGEQEGRILEVIVMIEYAKTATTLFYDGHDGFYNCGEDGEKIFYPVSHWMSLPEDPRKERK